MESVKKRKRAVAYVRVSSGSDAQIHSFEFQSAYWHNELDSNPDVEMVGIYADKGLSGRSMYKRPQFLTMMQDAREGKFDVIYTKSISRFGRNTVHLLESVRELRDLGVAVIFQNENINTLSNTSELFMTIAAALAESELEEDSKRQRWSYQDRFQNGWISIGSRMYGYRAVEGNQLEIIENEAAVVREIFNMYLGGMGTVAISKVLNDRGLKTSRGNPWSPNAILEIISNEKYTGDALMGKHVRINGVHKPAHARYAELLMNNLQEVGIEVTLNVQEVAAFRELTEQQRAQTAVITGLTAYGMGMRQGLAALYLWGENAMSYGQVFDPAYKELLDQVDAAENMDQYKAVAAEIQEYYAETIPAIALFWDAHVQAYNSRFSGFVVDGTFGIMNVQSWLSLSAAE